MAATRPVLPRLLIQTWLVASSTLDELELARQQGRRLGSLMIERRLITAARLLEVVSRQLGMPWISLEGVEIDEDLIKLVPASLATRHRLIPVYRRGGRTRDI